MSEKRDVRAEIEQAIAAGGLANDPLALTLRAIASSCEVMTEASERVAEARRRPFEPAVVAALVQEVAKTVPGAVRQQATIFVGEEVRKQAKAWAWKYAAAGFGLFLYGGVLAGMGVYRYEQSRVNEAERRADTVAAQIHETEAGLREAFAGGVNGAAGVWLPLMQWNDPANVRQTCQRTAAPEQPSGRHACTVRMWSEGPKPTAPKEAAR